MNRMSLKQRVAFALMAMLAGAITLSLTILPPIFPIIWPN